MKIFLRLLFLTFMIPAVASAQITLNSGRIPIPGNTFETYQLINNGFTTGNSGANQVWTYSNFTIGDTVTISYVSPSSTPNGNTFPSATVAEAPSGGTYIYYRGTPGLLEIVGTDIGAGVAPYTNPATVFTFPFSYGDNITDNFAADYTAQGFPVYRRGSIHTVGDAWGTLNLPSGSYTNVLRVRITQQVNDSTVIAGFPLVTRVTTDSYRWYNGTNKFPVFDISFVTTQVGAGNPTVDTVISYAPSQTVGIQQVGNVVPSQYKLSQNYPNPFNPATSISFDIPASGLVKLTVFDMLGKEVSAPVNGNLTAGSYRVDFNAAGLNSGVYFYRLESTGFVETRKMLLIK